MKTLLSFSLILFLIFAGVALPGCATDPETGEKIRMAAPSPPEAKLISNQIMRFALSEKVMESEKLETIRSIMIDSKTVLLTGLKEDPQNLDVIRLNYLKSKNPEMGELANTILQILVYRLRPLIDQGKTDLAASYIEAVLEGAVMAINTKLEVVSGEHIQPLALT